MRLFNKRNVVYLRIRRLIFPLHGLQEVRKHEADDQRLLCGVRDRLQLQDNLLVEEFHEVNRPRAIQHKPFCTKGQSLQPRFD